MIYNIYENNKYSSFHSFLNNFTIITDFERLLHLQRYKKIADKIISCANVNIKYKFTH